MRFDIFLTVMHCVFSLLSFNERYEFLFSWIVYLICF